ncbi:MAG: DMT family transporter [Spirochaetales bacterium]|nr:DMT family transporter [Spirochaetales bacterium]
MKKSIGITDWLALLLLSVLWGGSFFFNEIVLRQLSPFTLVFARVSLGALFLWVFILVGQSGSASSGSMLYGRFAVLAASLSYALGAIYGQKFSFSPRILTAGMLTAASIYLLPLVVFIDKPGNITIVNATWISMVSIALFSTALAYLIYFRLLSRIGPTNLLLVTFLIPLTALLLGMSLLGETPGLRSFKKYLHSFGIYFF